MHYGWILDVLDDLKAFARGNGLPSLAEQLEDTSLVAAAEIAQVSGLMSEDVAEYANSSRAFGRGPLPGGES
jgi:hypothetical protein